MRSILEELYYGNICPRTNCRENSPQTKELINYMATHHEKLLSSLNDQEKDTLEKFIDCDTELSEINEKEIFQYGFTLGMRIAIEVLFPNTNYH